MISDSPPTRPLPSPVSWTRSGHLRILDQTRLPGEEVHLELETLAEVAEAIASLRVRGAPLIGIAAAMGVAGAAQEAASEGILTTEWVESAVRRLESVRPTGTNVKWALTRIRNIAVTSIESNVSASAVAAEIRSEAQRIWDEDAAMCRAIGEHSAPLVLAAGAVLTHCNAGSLATGGIGTALAGIYVARERGWDGEVLATETRPLRQGARLTAWELRRAGVRVRLVADAAAGSLMAEGRVDLVLVGADRIAANGDTANKIGTYSLAVLARAHGIPVYVAAPSSTIDPTTPDGAGIPIEQRDPAELEPPPGVDGLNPAFDVTPAELVTGIVTEEGIRQPPYGLER